MGKYFGTDGIRGRANITLTNETAYNVGRFIGNYYKGNKIVIGKDTRLSSSMFESLLAAGISASGCDAYLLGYCSTPCLAFITCKDKYACGVMISASHNPYHDNGIKIFSNTGVKLADELETKIEAYLDNPTGIEYAVDAEIGKIISNPQDIKEYQDWINGLYPVDLRGFNLVADLAHGSNCVTAKGVLAKTGANIKYINDDFDGTNINNGCGSTHLEMLSNVMKEGKYDLGFAFDGDADRVLFVDSNGKVVDGDHVMYILACYLKKLGKLNGNKLVTTVMSNIGLFKAIQRAGIETEITAVGDKNVLDNMMNNKFIVGGEQSGHIIFSDDALFGDGLKTALFVLTVMKNEKKSINELCKDLIIYPQLLVNVQVKDKNVVLDDEDIKKQIEKVSKELGDNGRILVRPSGTEPLIRVMVETQSDEECNKYVSSVVDLIKQKGYAK